MPLKAQRIDKIKDAMDQQPWNGNEDEGIVINRDTLEVHSTIGGEQSTEAVKNALRELTQFAPPQLTQAIEEIVASICPDVPESTLEMNGRPLHSPMASMAAERLIANIVDSMLQRMGPYQLLHGAAWRAPGTTADDATRQAPFWKQIYYQRQIGEYGDGMSAAAGSHLNISTPWLNQHARQVDEQVVRMTGIVRLVLAALSIALSASSPLYYSQDGKKHVTTLSKWNSARLGDVWKNRTEQDYAELWKDPRSMRKTLMTFYEQGKLLTGRDIYAFVRAQRGAVADTRSLEEVCRDANLNMEADAYKIRERLMASFNYGPDPEHPENPFRDDAGWQAIENEWRRPKIEAFINALCNRVEIRTLETPPAFEDQTTYEYKKALNIFLTLVFVYLSETPEMVAQLDYDSENLSTAQFNEKAALTGTIDQRMHWIPHPTHHKIKARSILNTLLDKIENLAQALGYSEDLEPLHRIARGEQETPATRMRRETEEMHNLTTGYIGNINGGDAYPHHLLERNRASMHGAELQQIRHDIGRVTNSDDQAYLRRLEAVADYLHSIKGQALNAAQVA